VAAAALSFAAPNANAASLTGAGGTAIDPLVSKWAAQYAKETGDDINYQAIGSDGGIEQIESKTVLFANTDMPLKPEDVAKNGLVQFPQVIISITPVVYLCGIKSGELVFDGPTLANVYLGKIKEDLHVELDNQTQQNVGTTFLGPAALKTDTMALEGTYRLNSSPPSNWTPISKSCTSILEFNKRCRKARKTEECINETNHELGGACRHVGLRHRRCPTGQRQNRRAQRHVGSLFRRRRSRLHCSGQAGDLRLH
jgi:hypothetical protein